MIRKLRGLIVDTAMVRPGEPELKLQIPSSPGCHELGRFVKVAADGVVGHFGQAIIPWRPDEECAIKEDSIVNLVERDASVVRGAIGYLKHKLDLGGLKHQIAQGRILV